MTTRTWRSLGTVWRGDGTGSAPPPVRQGVAYLEWDLRHVDLGLSSGDCDPDDPDGTEMSVDPDSVGFDGQIPRRRRALKATERPFARPVDAWLARGGWSRGEKGNASVAVEWAIVPGKAESPEKRRIINRWRSELHARGWTSKLVRTKFVNYDDGHQRMFWWTTPTAVAMKNPPPPPERP